MKIRMIVIAAVIVAILLSVSLAAAQTKQELLRDAQGNLPSRTANPADDPKGTVGSLSGRTTSDLLTLGSVWQVQECCGWSGTWTRRAGTNTFDAKWRHTNGSQAQDVITLQSWNKATGEVVLARPSINGTYKATVNPSARTLTNGKASWYPAGEKWSARY
jgi:hypothetical protein